MGLGNTPESCPPSRDVSAFQSALLLRQVYINMVTKEEIADYVPVLSFFCSHSLAKTSHIMVPEERKTINLGMWLEQVRVGQRKETIRKHFYCTSVEKSYILNFWSILRIEW